MAWFSDKIGRKLNYMIETKVTYTLERDGHFYLVENVPARISPETGEQFFSPETVQRLQSFIFQKQEPKKLVQTPVFEFAVWKWILIPPVTISAYQYVSFSPCYAVVA